MADTSGLTNDVHYFKVELWDSAFNQISFSDPVEPGPGLKVMFENRSPTAWINKIHQVGPTPMPPIDPCAIVHVHPDGTDAYFTFDITVQHLGQYLRLWDLQAWWGDNKSSYIASDSYESHVASPPFWSPGPITVPAASWYAYDSADPTSINCAHTFYLGVWDRVINGYAHLHFVDCHDSITILSP